MGRDFERDQPVSSHRIFLALDALEAARRLPPGVQRAEALKAAGRLRFEAESVEWGVAIEVK